MKLNEFINFQKNLEKNVVTEQSLQETEIKEYFSGRKIKVGDVVLIGMLNQLDETSGLPITIINFCEEEIGSIYERDDDFTKENMGVDLPILKKIQK